jgi:hypothetical protein
MYRNTSITQAYLYNRQFREKSQKQFKQHVNNIEKIRKVALKEIHYPEFKEAYDYVDNLFPNVGVKDISIFKVEAKRLAKMGYGGAEGFYDSISKIVVICGARKEQIPYDKRFYVSAKIQKDEVIVHELCHYCYFFEGHRSVSTEIKEEFAYGWSMGYLRQKGYTDEQIIKKNFYPFLINVSQEEALVNILAQKGISHREYESHSRFQRKEFNRRFSGKIFLRAKEIALDRGYQLIEMYNRKMEQGTGCLDEEQESMDRFDLLDL